MRSPDDWSTSYSIYVLIQREEGNQTTTEALLNQAYGKETKAQIIME